LPFFLKRQNEINTMRKQITLEELIAYNNTPKAKALLNKYGYSPARDYNELAYKLNRFKKDYQEDALRELALLHPHRDLILHYSAPQTKETEQKKSCVDCNINQMQRFLNASGTQEQTNKNPFEMNGVATLIAVGLIGAVLIKAIG